MMNDRQKLKLLCSRGPALRLFAILFAAALALPSQALAEDGSGPGLVLESGDWSIGFEGAVRAGLTWVGAGGEQSMDFIGQNNGFHLYDAEIGVVVKHAEDLEVEVSFDGAIDERDDANDVVGARVAGLKDAYVRYKFGDFLHLMAGQYKPPFDAENLESKKDMTFIRRSVVSDGVLPGEGMTGINTDGFGPSRQLGVSLLSDVIDFGVVGVSYHLAATNGNNALQTRNDNDKLAYFGRLEVHLRNAMLDIPEIGSFLVLGGGAVFNQSTQGHFPTLLDVEDLNYGADLLFKAFGAKIMAQALWRTRSFPEIGQEDQKTFGLMAQAAYEVPLPDFRFEVGYRFANLDPVTSGDVALSENDGLTYHTIGLGYRLESLPIQIKANYTLTMEEGEEIDNDLLEGLVQFIW